MKTLHLTSHRGTRQNIVNVFNYLNVRETLVTESSVCNSYYITKEKADEIWKHYKNRLNDYNCLFFTDTSMVARPFLQNIDDHNLFIIVYITNRFDWGIFGFKDQEYINLYSKLSNHERVFFCADNNYDQYYATQNKISFFYNSRISLTPKLSQETHLYKKSTFFVYDRGTNFLDYKQILENYEIQYELFGQKYQQYRDTEHICEYKGIIHLPYQTNIQSLWENLGYYIIYFIPSKKFIKELIARESWYYWEEKHKSKDIFEKSIELAEWYIDDNKNLFEYFDSWEELALKTKNITHEYLLKKKKIIKEFMIYSNNENLLKWETIFSKIV
jgi:hypothetical protein